MGCAVVIGANFGSSAAPSWVRYSSLSKWDARLALSSDFFNIKATDSSNLRPSEAIPTAQRILGIMNMVRGQGRVSRETDTNLTILIKDIVHSRPAFKEAVGSLPMSRTGTTSLLVCFDSQKS
ncbi:DNA-directed RNA polymerase [Purpureocillium takamizusanense]|uniref:DNA-directed RNA polymerase n=1 Tax=Purpureocillium takamizusanense TaxID=2060973 RepID=A0A9Q8QD80_9HYPO|nr:DNA-directed RNA polymerase [Purpureocillium takamizusanense]UNI17858.1 DNA-directed RNA polymerase [Purpureocillium takamizusanense]